MQPAFFLRGSPSLVFVRFCCKQRELRFVRREWLLIRKKLCGVRIKSESLILKELEMVFENKALPRSLPRWELLRNTNLYPF